MKQQIVSVSLLCLFAVARSMSSADYSQGFTGKATYYGSTGGAGNCGLDGPVPSQYAGMLPVAINKEQYEGSASCGACISVTGKGTGSGNSPVTGTFLAYVADQCPECPHGNLDLAKDGDGIWDITWKFVECPKGTLEFKFQGSNPYYHKVQVRGVKSPTSRVTIGSVSATRENNDNFWVASPSSGAFDSPVAVGLETVLGEKYTVSVPGYTGVQPGTAMGASPTGAATTTQPRTMPTAAASTRATSPRTSSRTSPQTSRQTVTSSSPTQPRSMPPSTVSTRPVSTAAPSRTVTFPTMSVTTERRSTSASTSATSRSTSMSTSSSSSRTAGAEELKMYIVTAGTDGMSSGMPVEDGSTICPGDMPRGFSIVCRSANTLDGISFYVDNELVRTEYYPPYCIAGDHSSRGARVVRAWDDYPEGEATISCKSKNGAGVTKMVKFGCATRPMRRGRIPPSGDRYGTYPSLG